MDVGISWREVFKGNVGVIALSWILFGVGMSLTIPYFPLYIRMLGGEYIHIGLIGFWSNLISSFLTLLGGYIADVYGRKKIVVYLTWGLVATRFLYAAAPSWEIVLIINIAEACFRMYIPALSAILMDSLPPEKRAGGLLLAGSATIIPGLVFPPLGGYLLDTMGLNGLRLCYIISGVTGCLAAGLRMFMLKETFEVSERPKLSVAIVKAWREYVEGLKESPRGALILIGTTAFFTIPSTAVFRLYGVIYATEVVGLTGSGWGIFTSISNVVSLILSLTTFFILDRFPRKFLLLIDAAARVFLNFILVYPSPYTVLLAVVFSSISHSLTFSIRKALLADFVEKDLRGRLSAVETLSRTFSMSISNLLAGIIYSLNAIFSFEISCIIALLDAICVALFIREPRVKKL